MFSLCGSLLLIGHVQQEHAIISHLPSPPCVCIPMLQVRSAARKRWHRWQDNHALRVRVARAMSIPTSPTRISFHSIKQTTAVWLFQPARLAWLAPFTQIFRKWLCRLWMSEWASKRANGRGTGWMCPWQIGWEKASTVCVPLRLMRLKMNVTLRTRNTNWPFYPTVLGVYVLFQTVQSNIVPATVLVVAHLKSVVALNKPIFNHIR